MRVVENRVRPFLEVLIPVAIGLLLRAIQLTGRPIWYDEAFALMYARLPGALMAATPDLQHPPFYYLSLQTWLAVLDESVLTARALSLVYGVATIGVVFLIMRELFDRRVGLIAAWLMAVSPFQIAFSQEIRMYQQMGFWCTLSLWAFLRGARTNRLPAWIACGACGAAALYSHNLALAFFAALALFVAARLVLGLMRRMFRMALFSGSLTAGFIIAVLYGSWLTQLLSRSDELAQAYRITPPTALTFVQTLIAFGFWTDNQAAALPLTTAMLAGSVLVLLLIGHALIDRRHELDGRVGLLLVLFLGPPLIAALVSYALQPVYLISGLLPSQVAFLMLAAWAVARLPRLVWIAGAALLGAVLVWALVSHYSYAGFPRAPWSDISAYLRANAAAGDAVVHDNRLTFLPMRVIDPSLEQVYLADVIGIGVDVLPPTTQAALGIPATALEDATAGQTRVWLVLFSRTRAEYRAAGYADDPNWTALLAEFEVAEQKSFGEVDVALFARSR